MKNMKRRIKKRWLILLPSLLILCAIFIGAFLSLFSLQPFFEQRWRILNREVRKILGLKQSNEVPAEERRIREEVVLKKMDEASAQQDWRTLASEYPRLKKIEGATEEERMKALRSLPEFQELEKEFKSYIRKREDQLVPEPPLPSIKEASKMPKRKDEAEEKIVEKLLAVKERPSPEKALEENLRLGIRGPLVNRKILERPPPPQVRVKVEAEIEMTVWVLPSGMVDRVIPALKGDAELERIASQYLKRWRFIPLPKDQPQVEQWGTIPIKFKLQ